jgi:hypothetical protein
MKFFWPALGILFIAFKLTAVISWPWWAVLAPLWGPVAVVFLVMALIVSGARKR